MKLLQIAILSECRCFLKAKKKKKKTIGGISISKQTLILIEYFACVVELSIFTIIVLISQSAKHAGKLLGWSIFLFPDS